MIKKILTTSLVTSMLILGGCGDSEGESRLETQHMLDKGDFAGVISKLENGDTTNEEYLLLASAYVGNAGLSLADLLNAISQSTGSDDDENDIRAEDDVEVENEEEESPFVTFVETISTSTQDAPSPLYDLQKATKTYRKVIGTKCAAAANIDRVLSDTQKDVCLFLGVTEALRAATSITYMTDDVAALAAGEENNKLKASACALTYFFDGSNSDCTITQEENVIFTQIEQEYERIKVQTNGESFGYLVSIEEDTKAKEVILTDGFCTLDDFSTRVKNKSDLDDGLPLYYVCPVRTVADSEEITIKNSLLDALNSASDSIATAGSGSEDMVESINELKCDILGGVYEESCSIDASQTLTMDNVIDYINEQNK